MILCPKNSHLYGEHKAKDEQLADWCERTYRPGSERCQGCELKKKWGVGAEPAPRKEVEKLPEQGRLF